MNELKNYWQTLSHKFSNLSKREKWLVTIAGWIGLLFLLYTFLVEPAQIQKNAKTVQLAAMQGQIGELSGKVAELNRKLEQDPNERVDEEYQQLLEQSQDLSMELSQVVSSLVTPTAMAELLEQVLNQTHKLKLISLESLPNEPIMLDNPTEDIGYYIHPVKIVLTGNYFDIEAYLAKLEQMTVKYYWRSFDYQVEEYPQARLELVVYTLGAKEEFIGG